MGSRSGGVDIPVIATWNNKALTRAEKQMQSFSKSVTKSFAGIGAGLGAALGLSAVADQMGKMVTAGSDLAESQSKIAVVFGTSAKAISDWADTSSTSLLMSKQAALEAAGTYGNLFQAFGIGQTKAAEMSKTLVKTAADLASFNNTSVDDALVAIRSGLSGETEPLKRYGAALTDARLRQEAMSQGIYDGVGILNAGQKAQAAYSLILKDTALAQGDVERTADGFANTSRAVTAELENMQAKIGGALVTSIMDLSTSLGGKDGAVENLRVLGDNVKNVVLGVDELVKGIKILKGDTDTAFSWIPAVKDAITGLARQQIWGLGMATDTLTYSYEKLNAAGDASAKMQAGLDEELSKSYEIRHRLDALGGSYSKALDSETDSAQKATEAQKKHAAALTKVKEAFDRLNGKNISVAEARLNMRELKAGGPTATGERTVKTSKVNKDGSITYGTKVKKFVTRDDKLRYAIEVARGASDLGSAIFDKGNGSPTAQARAAAAYAAGRKTIRGTGLGAGVARDFLSTPRALTPAATAAAANVAQSVVNNYNFWGGINAATPQAAIEIAKKAARLSKLSGRHVNAGLG